MLALADKEIEPAPRRRRADLLGGGGSTSSIEQTWLEVLYSFGEDHGLADEAGGHPSSATTAASSFEDEETRESILALRRDPLILRAAWRGEMLARVPRPPRGGARPPAPRRNEGLRWRISSAAVRRGPDSSPFKDSHPDAAAAAEFGAAARANRAIFYQNGRPLSYAEVDARIARGDRRPRRPLYAPSLAPFTPRRPGPGASLASCPRETAVYASLKGAEMEMIEAGGFRGGGRAPSPSPWSPAGRNGETVPLPPRR